MSFNPRKYYKKHVSNEYTLNVITSVCHFPLNNNIICPEKSVDFSGLCLNHTGHIIRKDQMKHTQITILSIYLNTIEKTTPKLDKLKIANIIFSFQLLYPYMLFSNAHYYDNFKLKLNEFKNDDYVKDHLQIFNPHNFYTWMLSGEKLDYSNPRYDQNIPDNIEEVEFCGDLVYINERDYNYTLIL